MKEVGVHDSIETSIILMLFLEAPQEIQFLYSIRQDYI